jgi:hypothetical protein
MATPKLQGQAGKLNLVIEQGSTIPYLPTKMRMMLSST